MIIKPALTILEEKLLVVLAKCTYGDTNKVFPALSSEDVYAEFGILDQETRGELIKVGITGKMISGITSSLVQKGVLATQDDEEGIYWYMPGTIYEHYSKMGA